MRTKREKDLEIKLAESRRMLKIAADELYRIRSVLGLSHDEDLVKAVVDLRDYRGVSKT